jgi:hypothetical protein
MMSEPLKPLPLDWVEAIYRKLTMFWGDAFVRKWEAIPYDELMVAWSEELAGFTPEELKRGLAACKNRNFPVSFPEFVNLCRPVITPEEALAEAVAQSQMRPLGRDKWSHPAIFWTYYALSWEFKNLPTKDLEKRWGPEFKRIMSQGKWEPIPEIKTELVSYTPEPEVRSTLGKKGFDELMAKWRVE